MNWAFLRREWGAVTFVLTVLVGMVAVPLALYLNNQGAAPVSVPQVVTTISSAARASGVHSPSPSPAHSPSPTPTKSP